MPRQRKASRQTNERQSNAGGSATHSGIGFQDHSAAWIAVRILDEQNASALWDLASTITLEQLFCETNEPVDDLLVVTSVGGCVFIQAKHGLKLEKKVDSDLASCLDQFTLQYHLGAWDATKKARRPLDETKDRMVILVCIHSPETIRAGVPSLLTKLRRLLPGQTSKDAALNDNEQQHFEVIRTHIRRSWQAHTGEPPSEADTLQLLSFVRVQTLHIDEGGNDELWAKDMLRRSILQDPPQADSAWDRLYRTFANRSITHSGIDRKRLQQILLDAHIEINAVRSYRTDIEHLQLITSNTLSVLSPEAEIVIGQEVVKIDRPSVRLLQAAAAQGSLVVLGLPGVGKSVALYDLVTIFRAEGKDVVFLTADSLLSTSRLTHDIADVLRNWPGSQPAFLIVDSLDTARFSQSERTLWVLITQMMTSETENRWRVIVSTRIFDAMKNPELRRLFAGSPPEETLQDENFPYLRHIAIQPLSAEELQQAAEQSPTLAPLLKDAGPELQDLLRIPFNLRLVKELLLLGTPIRDLVQMRAQIQLLDLYWLYRVERSDGQQYAREWVLGQACERMVNTQTFHVDLALLARPDASSTLYDLQNAHLLTPWRPDAHSGADASILTFSHRILFDYAVARLLLSGDPKKNILDRFVAKPTLVIAIRPSLVYRCQKEWMKDPTRSSFWRLTLLLLRNETISNLGKLVGPTVATELATHLTDFVPLLTWLESEDKVLQQEAEKALQHVVGAIVAQQHRPPVGIAAGPWSALLAHISQILRGSLAFFVRLLLSHVIEYPELFTSDQQDQIGKSARRLLEFAWEQPARDFTYMYFALQGVCRTYASDPSASQSLLRRCLEPTHLSTYGYEELPVIAHESKWLIASAPQFASDIYVAGFSYEETSEEKTPLGASQILSLQSTRRQEYSTALYAFAEAFPEMLRQNTLVALQTLIRIMDHQRPEENDPLKQAFFDFNGAQARIQFESIGFWSTLDDPSPHDPLGQMIIAFVAHLAHIANDSQFADERKSLIQLLIAQNRHGLLWRRLLMEGTNAPQTLGQEIRPLAWAVPILTASATSQVVGAFLAVLFEKLVVEERERIERAILSLPTIVGPSVGEQMRDRLLGCLPSSALVIEESKAYVEQFNARGGAPSNEPFIPVVVEWSSEQPEEDDVYRRFRKTIQTFILRHQQTPPTTQEVEAIFPWLQALEMALSTVNMSQDADPHRLLSATGDLAEASGCIIGWNEFSCTSTIGQFVLSVLLNASTHKEPVYSPQSASDFDKNIISGKPAPRIDAASGLPRLAFYKTCAGTTVLDAIRRLSSDPVPAVRYNVVIHIRNLYQTAPDLMWEILEQKCENESSRGVLWGKLNALQSLASLHPDRIFELTKKIYDRVPSEAEAVQVRKACIATFTWLYIHHDHTLSHQIVLAAADKPGEYADENGQMLIITRPYLNFGSVTPSDLHTTQAAVRQRAWSIVESLARSVTQALQQCLQQSEEVEAGKDDKQLRNLLRLIDVIGSDLYFASGASSNSNEPEKSLEEKKRFWMEVEPLLDILDTIPVRNVTHHLLQMLEFLAPANPSSIFLRMGHMVLNGKESGYQYESFAVDLIVRAIERYLAEFQDVFREDGECLQTLIRVLDIFVDVGWPSARRLAYQIDVIFQ